MEKIPMTREGSLVLEAELKKLKSVERPSIIQAISEARDTAIYQKMLSTIQLVKNKAL